MGFTASYMALPGGSLHYKILTQNLKLKLRGGGVGDVLYTAKGVLLPS